MAVRSLIRQHLENITHISVPTVDDVPWALELALPFAILRRMLRIHRGRVVKLARPRKLKAHPVGPCGNGREVAAGPLGQDAGDGEACRGV